MPPQILDDLKVDPRLGGQAVLIETHISWVLMGPTEVLKLKRPVTYDFADFSTLSARRHACEEELRLNRRLAPDVYKELVAVTWDGQRHRFAGPGQIVDWAVSMRRLPAEDAVSVRLQEGRFTLGQVEALATRLARFYEQAPVATNDAASLFHHNFDELATLFTEPNLKARLAKVEAKAITALAAARPRLATRQAAGFSRDGHGDLRLEHVYFEGTSDTPLVIDTVEFEPAFRAGDRALDAAFFAMELELAGRSDLAAWFWSCLARDLNDYTHYPLIDLFVSYRAAVRAKIAILVSRAPGTPEARKQSKQRESDALWWLCERTVDGLHTGKKAVVCVGGLVGAGKSVVADALVPLLCGPVISSDRTRKSLAGLAPTQVASAQHYTDAFSQQTLAAMRTAAHEVLCSGRAVILDATFRASAWRQVFRELAEQHQAPFLFIEARCGEAELRRRLQARALRPGVSDAREAQLAPMAAEFQPPVELPAEERCVIDTEVPVAQALTAAVRRFR